MISVPVAPEMPTSSPLRFEDWFNIANCATQRLSIALFDDQNFDRAMGEAESMSHATCRAFDEAISELTMMNVLAALANAEADND